MNSNQCSFCGKKRNEVQMLISGKDGFICENCIEQAHSIVKDTVSPAGFSPAESMGELKKPKEIKEFLNQYVIGQDQAKKQLSIAVYNHYKRLLHAKDENREVELEKSNIIMIGETGTGKTLLAKTIAKELNVPFCIVDATILTEAGYVGEDVESILSRLLMVADYDVEKAEKGIVFIDEIDKIASQGSSHGPEVSREGVQRDLLPIVEGCSVNTRYGTVHTQHVLFIASGAFHVSKPSDLVPELQGRFPIRVELKSLTEEDFVKILTFPENALIKQYTALVQSENIELTFDDSAIAEIASIAARVNEEVTNIGARRLHTIMTTLLEEILYNAPDNIEENKIIINDEKVKQSLNEIVQNTDLSKYIL